MAAAGTVLHFAPHPDDELLGAPATLMALRDAGYRIVNVACGLGSEDQASRRRAELEEACRRAGFHCEVVEAPVAASLAVKLRDHAPEIVVSPSPHDRHPTHERVAREVRGALESVRNAPRWFVWGLWAALPLPTLATAFDESRLAEIVHALEAHAGELSRNDYRRLLEGRSAANAVLAAELLSGFGARGGNADYAELLTELARQDDKWLFGQARWLDPNDPLPDPTGTDAAGWLDRASITEVFGAPGKPKKAPSLSPEERQRLWDWTLHEDTLFSDRQNLFLVAEAMLVAGYAEALDLGAGRIPETIALTGLVLTLIWAFVGWRQHSLVEYIQRHARRELLEYGEICARRPPTPGGFPIRSRDAIAFGLPALLVVLWSVLLIW